MVDMIIEVKIDDILQKRKSEKINLFVDKSLQIVLKKNSLLQRTLIIQNLHDKLPVYMRVETSIGSVLIDDFSLPAKTSILFDKIKTGNIDIESLCNVEKLLFICSKEHPLKKKLDDAQRDLYIEKMKKAPSPTPYIPYDPPVKPHQPWIPAPRQPWDPWDSPRYPDPYTPGDWPPGKVIWSINSESLSDDSINQILNSFMEKRKDG